MQRCSLGGTHGQRKVSGDEAYSSLYSTVRKTSWFHVAAPIDTIPFRRQRGRCEQDAHHLESASQPYVMYYFIPYNTVSFPKIRIPCTDGNYIQHKWKPKPLPLWAHSVLSRDVLLKILKNCHFRQYPTGCEQSEGPINPALTIKSILHSRLKSAIRQKCEPRLTRRLLMPKTQAKSLIRNRR